MRRIRDLVSGDRKPTKRLAEILDCSSRTARRLLNSGDSAPLLRRAYAHKVSRILGLPMEEVYSLREQPGGVELRGWKTEDTTQQARQTAATLGLLICNLASMAFKLPASFSVVYGLDDRPTYVEVTIVTGPGRRSSLRWYYSDAMGAVVMRYTDANNAIPYDAIPSWSAVKTILSILENEQKNCTT
jgi:hypothetical protein